MAHVQKALRGKNTYYYLEHAVREGDRVQKKKLYVGDSIPHNIEELKEDFLQQVRRVQWELALKEIQNAYRKEKKCTPESVQQKERETFAVQFTYDSQKIEGSTLTLRETADILQRGISPVRKPLTHIQEAEGHKKAFDLMLQCKKDLSMQVILHWHRTLLEHSHPEIAGKIRQHQVAIAGSTFVPPSPVEVDILLREFFATYKKKKKELHPVELAAYVHLAFVTIHPFADGNGRLSRLMMNFILHRNGYPLFSIPYSNRHSYYTALERAQTKQQDHTFIQWFLKRYVQTQRKRYRIK